jgi:hypothetical protein
MIVTLVRFDFLKLLSVQERNRMEEDAKKILSILRTESCRNHLRAVKSGTKSSQWHTDFRGNGLLQSGLGPFTTFDDLVSGTELKYIA